ncbi:OLC1v1017259C1 [Oldenlandia corymbosa var. corymbosa]|uniref:OLC1v1017259C1 n=1 Tax=Oldenlandia corymbosa var. corymbosa TaxID=529605 RepID=A0AAV1E8Z5_OLDCO|nr:OLC1v1017259C1 [Oldenlandia corymbosa var. corymbosa]
MTSELKYVGGRVYYFDFIDEPNITVELLRSYIDRVCSNGPHRLFYKDRNRVEHSGYKHLLGYEDVKEMSGDSTIQRLRGIDVYRIGPGDHDPLIGQCSKCIKEHGDFADDSRHDEYDIGNLDHGNDASEYLDSDHDTGDIDLEYREKAYATVRVQSWCLFGNDPKLDEVKGYDHEADCGSFESLRSRNVSKESFAQDPSRGGKNLKKGIRYVAADDMRYPGFEVWQDFEDKWQLLKYIKLHSVADRRHISFKKHDSKYVRAICKGEGCNWVLYAVKVSPNEETFQIRTHQDKHTCPRLDKTWNCTAHLIAESYLEDVAVEPTLSSRFIKHRVKKDHGLKISRNQASRAKKKALDINRGSFSSCCYTSKNVSHRYCMEHLWNNFKLKHPGLKLKARLTNIAKATTEEEWNKLMDDLKKHHEGAWRERLAESRKESGCYVAEYCGDDTPMLPPEFKPMPGRVKGSRNKRHDELHRVYKNKKGWYKGNRKNDSKESERPLGGQKRATPKQRGRPRKRVAVEPLADDLRDEDENEFESPVPVASTKCKGKKQILDGDENDPVFPVSRSKRKGKKQVLDGDEKDPVFPVSRSKRKGKHVLDGDENDPLVLVSRSKGKGKKQKGKGKFQLRDEDENDLGIPVSRTKRKGEHQLFDEAENDPDVPVTPMVDGAVIGEYCEFCENTSHWRGQCLEEQLTRWLENRTSNEEHDDAADIALEPCADCSENSDMDERKDQNEESLQVINAPDEPAVETINLVPPDFEQTCSFWDQCSASGWNCEHCYGEFKHGEWEECTWLSMKCSFCSCTGHLLHECVEVQRATKLFFRDPIVAEYSGFRRLNTNEDLKYMLALLSGEMKSPMVIYRIGKLEYDQLPGGAKPKPRKPAYLDEGDDDTDDEDYEPESDYSCDSDDERVQKLANHSMSGSCWGTLKKTEFVRHANHDGGDDVASESDYASFEELHERGCLDDEDFHERSEKNIESLIQRKRWAIRFQKNAKFEVRGICVPGCNWEVYGVKLPDVDTFEVRTVNNKHTCGRIWEKNKNCNSNIVSDWFVADFANDSSMSVSIVQFRVVNEKRITISRTQAYRAKLKALEKKLFEIAKSSYVEEHDELMAALKEFDEGAWVWLQNEDAGHWCRSHFPTATRCDCVTNNPPEFKIKIGRPKGSRNKDKDEPLRRNKKGSLKASRKRGKGVNKCSFCRGEHIKRNCPGFKAQQNRENNQGERGVQNTNPPIRKRMGRPPKKKPQDAGEGTKTGVPVHQPELQPPINSTVDENSVHETEPKHTGNAGQEVDDEVALDIHFKEETECIEWESLAAALKDPRSGIIRPKVTAPAPKKCTRICTSSAPTTPRRASARLMNLALAKKMDVNGPGSTYENVIQILTEEEASTFLRKKPKTFHGVDPHQG